MKTKNISFNVKQTQESIILKNAEKQYKMTAETKTKHTNDINNNNRYRSMNNESRMQPIDTKLNTTVYNRGKGYRNI